MLKTFFHISSTTALTNCFCFYVENLDIFLKFLLYYKCHSFSNLFFIIQVDIFKFYLNWIIILFDLLKIITMYNF